MLGLNTVSWGPTLLLNYAALRGMPDPDTSYLNAYDLENIATGSRRINP